MKKNSTNTVNKGKEGEEIAVKHLKDNGFCVLHTNWRHKKKEIDIIAEKNGYLVVVEVKTRHGDFELPCEAVTKAKQRFIIEAANAYVEKYCVNKEVRFDIIAIQHNANSYTIEHIEDAFYPLMK